MSAAADVAIEIPLLKNITLLGAGSILCTSPTRFFQNASRPYVKSFNPLKHSPGNIIALQLEEPF